MMGAWGGLMRSRRDKLPPQRGERLPCGYPSMHHGRARCHSCTHAPTQVDTHTQDTCTCGAGHAGPHGRSGSELARGTGRTGCCLASGEGPRRAGNAGHLTSVPCTGLRSQAVVLPSEGGGSRGMGRSSAVGAQ
jgi:hypothetical protein